MPALATGIYARLGATQASEIAGRLVRKAREVRDELIVMAIEGQVGSETHLQCWRYIDSEPYLFKRVRPPRKMRAPRPGA